MKVVFKADASIVEKHFTLDRNGGGPDDSFSLEPADLLDLCRDSETVWRALGKVNYGRKSSEIENLKFRRSLYFVKDVNNVEMITTDMVRSIRPGYGLLPKHLDDVLGKKAKSNVVRGSAVTWELLC